LADSAFCGFARVLSAKRTFSGRTNFCPLNLIDNGNSDTLNAGRKGGHGRVVSGAMNLLTNIVMAWNTQRIAA
jgi:hypothetical protein